MICFYFQQRLDIKVRKITQGLHRKITRELATIKLSQTIPVVNHKGTTRLIFSNELPINIIRWHLCPS